MVEVGCLFLKKFVGIDGNAILVLFFCFFFFFCGLVAVSYGWLWLVVDKIPSGMVYCFLLLRVVIGVGEIEKVGDNFEMKMDLKCSILNLPARISWQNLSIIFGENDPSIRNN